MIPGKIFTSFAEFQGIVSVNDFRFHLGFQELDITIWVLRKARVRIVLTRTVFHFCSRLHWKFMR